ncbi:MBL fold metallo-hydrolase [Thermodesulfobacteriota bacterium]
MRIRQPGKICENLWFLGQKESCVYLLEGNTDSMIISGGMGYIVPDLLRQFEEFGIDETRIKNLLILHSHFDHVGIVPFLKRRNAELALYASARAWEILQMPKAIKTINEFGRDTARRIEKEDAYATHDLEWRGDIKGTAVSEGDFINLGDLKGRIYETPGHSSCSISFYVPQLKALFASDSGGIPYKNTIVTSGNSNFTKYQTSLEKLKSLDTRYVCADHYGYVAGDEAKDFIKNCIEAARDYRALLENTYRRTGDIEIAAKEIAVNFLRENENYFLTQEVMEGVYRQMLRHIVGTMED